ncbi:hypothetical protein HK104_006579 [Borealophlyctis nickersoniae]|nr:hypothetical protein HK104_006579 [Borealophlyctis nickersoniae]
MRKKYHGSTRSRKSTQRSDVSGEETRRCPVPSIETLQSTSETPPPRAAKGFCPFDLLPVELWEDILSYLPSSALFILRDSCSSFRTLCKPFLLDSLLSNDPISSLYNFSTDGSSEPLQQLFHLHKFVLAYVAHIMPPEPPKYPEESVEYDPAQHDDSYAHWRKARKESKAYLEWEEERANRVRSLRRDLAKCWIVAGKRFPFTKVENGVWKERRRAKLEKNEEMRIMEGDQHLERDQDQSGIRSPPHHARKRRPNKSGEEDFHRQILTPHITIEHFDYYWLFHDKALFLRLFASDAEARVLKFPTDFDSQARKRLHEVAAELGLRTMSFGEGSGRFLVAMKRDVVVFHD